MEMNVKVAEELSSALIKSYPDFMSLYRMMVLIDEEMESWLSIEPYSVQILVGNDKMELNLADGKLELLLFVKGSCLTGPCELYDGFEEAAKAALTIIKKENLYKESGLPDLLRLHEASMSTTRSYSDPLGELAAIKKGKVTAVDSLVTSEHTNFVVLVPGMSSYLRLIYDGLNKNKKYSKYCLQISGDDWSMFLFNKIDGAAIKSLFLEEVKWLALSAKNIANAVLCNECLMLPEAVTEDWF